MDYNEKQKQKCQSNQQAAGAAPIGDCTVVPGLTAGEPAEHVQSQSCSVTPLFMTHLRKDEQHLKVTTK